MPNQEKIQADGNIHQDLNDYQFSWKLELQLFNLIMEGITLIDNIF